MLKRTKLKYILNFASKKKIIEALINKLIEFNISNKLSAKNNFFSII